ncbi:iron uptake protein [Lysobacter auxotrophicus]|uniref:Iron uptake protein n=1 Tax=Lysobacter auxotrophicus TaxID=2992573 RepID=A0ABN6UJT5_9GAMM|nr:iron uptake protein [Lysobacter auxotrophicus]BDU16567.1 iron uptake protein [Lysobacter auxotrophicus]
MSTTTASSFITAPRLRVASRVAAAVLGGYAFAWGVVALTTAVLFALELDFHDAEFAGAVAGLLAYLAVFLWAIAARRLAVVWSVLLAGGALMTGAASLVQSALV